MAERRMFSKRIINSARFLKMPVSTQCLYFHLGLHADDDGIVEAYTVMNSVGATEDDLKLLFTKGFVVVLNEDLVTYITDWNENNKLRADRKVDSIYKDLLLQVVPDVQLIEKKQRADVKRTTNGQPMDNQRTSNGPHRIGKDRIGEDSIVQDNKKKKRNTIDYAKILSKVEDQSLVETYQEYIKMRKLIKAPMTEKALEMLISKVNSLEPHNVERQKMLLNKSIINNWKSVYPLDDKQQSEQKQGCFDDDPLEFWG